MKMTSPPTGGGGAPGGAQLPACHRRDVLITLGGEDRVPSPRRFGNRGTDYLSRLSEWYNVDERSHNATARPNPRRGPGAVRQAARRHAAAAAAGGGRRTAGRRAGAVEAAAGEGRAGHRPA
jgi:hypothetical protein